jgi:hypothetical protein
MKKIRDIRLENARNLIERVGGVGKMAGAMGYANPSFLVQVFGPSPTRNVTEKMVRKMEVAAGLSDGALDKDDSQASAPFDMEFVLTIIRFVGEVAASEGVQVEPDRFASLVQLAISDAREHSGRPREAHLRQVLQLLK